MKKSEAAEVVAMIRSATSTYRQDAATTDYWQTQMLGLDAETATLAVIVGAKEWRFFPSWAQFLEIYRAEKKKADALSEPLGDQRLELPEGTGKRGVEAPEWVLVWSWARTRRDPHEDRSFPQQEGFVDPMSMMTMEDYEALRKEWIKAGRPKSRNLLPVEIGR